jgi:DNA uptake protein ComE-like DNA-binding protein
MKPPHFYRYSKSQRNGIMALFGVVIAIQLGYYVVTSAVVAGASGPSEAEKEWLAHQAEIDVLKAQNRAKKDTIYPINPNYISDYKGYALGMSNEEIDRLSAYRKSGRWINSAADFKQVTGVSDALLDKLSPYFKFPGWVGKGVQDDGKMVASNDELIGNKGVVYPFNPNFIDLQKGRELGMTKEQVGRLKAYRDSGKWINTVYDFKEVTGVSDALLNKISPHFKFPDWVVKKYQQGAPQRGKKPSEPAGPPKDINEALEEDLTEIYGIGPNSAKKILRRRAALGAYVDMSQMSDFKEFSSKAIAGLQKGFTVGAHPDVTKCNVNTASFEKLSRFPYFNEEIAAAIITLRNTKGKINEFDDLLKINEIFTLKSKIISLYLEY